MSLLLSILTKLVLVALVALSVISVKTILEIKKRLQKIQIEEHWQGMGPLFSLRSEAELNTLSEKLSGHRKALLSIQGLNTGTKGHEAMILAWRSEWEKGLGLLATIGANAPFIGLLGTVLGIIQAFGALSQANSSQASSQVMSAIAEALTATAVGLAVAIPAVVFYNLYTKKIRNLIEEAQAISAWAESVIFKGK